MATVDTVEHTFPIRSNSLRLPEPGEIWLNHKGGRYYINHIGTDTESGEPSVAYFPSDQYEDYRRDGPGAVSWYHRPLGIFLGTTKTPSGGHVRRFVRSSEQRGG